MENISTKIVSDFQTTNVGRPSSDYNLIVSIIFCSILGLIGLGLCITAFIPYKKNINCDGKDTDKTCTFNDQVVCDLNKKDCYIKEKRYYLIIPGIVFLCVAGLITYMSFLKKDIYRNSYSKELNENID